MGCSNNRDKKKTDSKPTEAKQIEENKITQDTLTSSFPVRIGNDTGVMKIAGLKTFENKELINSKFNISLTKIQGISVFKEVDKEILINSNERVHLKDTINRDYLDNAILKSIEFNFARGNTL